MVTLPGLEVENYVGRIPMVGFIPGDNVPGWAVLCLLGADCLRANMIEA